MEYKKPPLTYNQQIDLLISRGLEVSDRDYVVSILKRISYYRLSAYCIPFQPQKDTFKKGVTIKDILCLYDFDHELRMLIFDAFEKLEVFIRTTMIYYLAHSFGAFGYLDKKNFHRGFKHAEWIADIKREITISTEMFISSYKTKYHKQKGLPIWMAAEVISFGKLSQVYYKGLNYRDQKAIAKIFGISHIIMASWLHMLVYARNICAHHARLWNKALAIRPKFPEKDKTWQFPEELSHKRSFALFVVAYFFMNKIGRGERFKEKLVAILKAKPPIVKLDLMGFPTNWEEMEAWNNSPADKVERSTEQIGQGEIKQVDV